MESMGSIFVYEGCEGSNESNELMNDVNRYWLGLNRWSLVFCLLLFVHVQSDTKIESRNRLNWNW